MWHVCRKEVLKGLWRGDVKKRDHTNDLVIDKRIILKWILKTWEWRHGLA
jgi:hypothetical protein